jgi:D-alanyl-D-alanine carboxypeptidase/D-alanyl-D-alanine-endopeptidase (penicillin-binding protein 4)
MKGTCAEGNCHAKTGTLRNASGLAGYVTGLNGKEYIFAIISNGNNVGAYKRLENSVVQTIANYKSAK